MKRPVENVVSDVLVFMSVLIGDDEQRQCELRSSLYSYLRECPLRRRHDLADKPKDPSAGAKL